jgi:PadR family transcriptional regulator, regulatory protein AphA
LTVALECTKPIYIELEYIGVWLLNVRDLCLGYLSLREATGYEIKKDFEEGLFCHFMEASYGSIYPALGQLASEGLLTVREEEQSGKPDKKVYAITETGALTLKKALSVLPARDKYKSEFLFMMLLQNHIAVEHRINAIEKQLADLKGDLSSISECKQQAGCNAASDFVMGYGEAVLTAGVAYLEDELAKVNQQTARKAAE